MRTERSKLVTGLQAALGRRRVLDAPAATTAYEYDASLARSRPDIVVFPESAEEVALVVKRAGEARLPVVARGAGTGLSGGSVPSAGGVVICFTWMNRILELDPRNRLAVVEPGVINADLTRAAHSSGLYYAPDPSSEKICTLGGNVAENSGGAHCLAHGTTTNYVLGLEVVLAGGRIARFGSLGGETSGYDLTGLAVGSEGTLGIVTKIALRLRRRAEDVRTLLMSFADVRSAGQAVTDVIAAGILPVALELMDARTVRAVEEALHPGFPADAGAILLVETEGVREGLDGESERIAALCRAAGATTTRLAENASQRDAFWAGRKGARSVLGRLRPNYYVHDGVVPRTKIAEALEAIEEIASRHELPVATYLHAGDGNIHPNILFDAADPDEARRSAEAGREILKLCVDMGGTLSGEHGIGVEKRPYMSWVFSAADLSAMRRVKEAFDPANALNPGKILEAAPQPTTAR